MTPPHGVRETVRRSTRRSGVAACFGAVLFAIAGLTYYSQIGEPPDLHPDTWSAGEPIPIGHDFPDLVVWAVDYDGSADDVVCTVAGSRFEDGPLPAGPAPGHESAATVEAGDQTLTYLARVRFVRDATVTCEGPGLGDLRVAEDVRPDLARGSSTAFFIGSGVAALWAVLTLGLTRRRSDDA